MLILDNVDMWALCARNYIICMWMHITVSMALRNANILYMQISIFLKLCEQRWDMITESRGYTGRAKEGREQLHSFSFHAGVLSNDRMCLLIEASFPGRSRGIVPAASLRARNEDRGDDNTSRGGRPGRC